MIGLSFKCRAFRNSSHATGWDSANLPSERETVLQAVFNLSVHCCSPQTVEPLLLVMKEAFIKTFEGIQRCKFKMDDEQFLSSLPWSRWHIWQAWGLSMFNSSCAQDQDPRSGWCPKHWICLIFTDKDFRDYVLLEISSTWTITKEIENSRVRAHMKLCDYLKNVLNIRKGSYAWILIGNRFFMRYSKAWIADKEKQIDSNGGSFISRKSHFLQDICYVGVTKMFWPWRPYRKYQSHTWQSCFNLWRKKNRS